MAKDYKFSDFLGKEDILMFILSGMLRLKNQSYML